MENPVALLREQLNKDDSSKEKNPPPVPKLEDIKEKERLEQLHEGWLQHPVTIYMQAYLGHALRVKHDLMCKHALMNPVSPNPYTVEYATLDKVRKQIEQNIPYA